MTSEFTEELASEVLPKIMEVRASPEPITVFINSRGGSTHVLDTISGALKANDADGKSSRIITVALGQAGSAAATLLVLGHYSIAYPYSTIHFHGGRFGEIGEMTRERALVYADELKSLNRKNANVMSSRIIGRIVRRYVQIMPELAKSSGGQKTSMEDFINEIRERVSWDAERVIMRTMDRIKQAHDLYGKAYKKGKSGIERSIKSGKNIATEVCILKAVIDCVVKNYESAALDSLDDFLMDEISEKYLLVREYQVGEHYQSMFSLIRGQGPALLTGNDVAAYEALDKADVQATVNWLYGKIGSKLRWLWHFSVLLARELQSGENRVNARDAYWMGCIDEVIGTKHRGERADVETEIIPESPLNPPDPSTA